MKEWPLLLRMTITETPEGLVALRSMIPLFRLSNYSYYFKETMVTLVENDHYCDPRGIQTPDLQNRNLTFYSAELWGQVVRKYNSVKAFLQGYCNFNSKY